jgi:hypothetical membrane protein
MPLISFEGYSILSNTTSHLGAQGSPNAWIMNLLFILMGLISIIIVISSKVRVHQIFGSLFGISLTMTGIFRHESLIESYLSNMTYDKLHSLFATLTGFSFVLIAYSHGFMSEKKQRGIGIFVGIVTTLISISMGVFTNYIGILQRVMFVIAFGWLFFVYKPPVNKQVVTKS